jgi:hypothetical protein
MLMNSFCVQYFSFDVKSRAASILDEMSPLKGRANSHYET